MKKTNQASASTRRRIHRSPAQWQTLLSAQAQSGLSQQAFCERERVSTVSLSNWRKRLRESAAAPMASTSMPPPFIELTNATRPLDAGIKVRIELGAGVVLELSMARRPISTRSSTTSAACAWRASPAATWCSSTCARWCVTRRRPAR